MTRYISLVLAGGLLLSANLATAGTKVQGNVVANVAGTDPQLSGKSKYKVAGDGSYQVNMKGITDSMGNPAPVTTGTTPDTQYFAILKGDVNGVLWEYNIPFNIAKAGQAKLKGSIALISSVPTGSAVGVLGVEIFEPTTAGTAADCQAVLSGSLLPGVYIFGLTSTDATNPCASGARVGISGVLTGE